MNELIIFKNPELGEIRTLTINGEPWFVGKDVAKTLGYSNPSKAVMIHVDKEDQIIQMLPNSQNGNSVGKHIIINESGLYSLILSSKLPNAKKFKHWVTAEVLPQIRKTGGYMGNVEEIIAKTATAVVSEVVKQLIPVIQQVVSRPQRNVCVISEVPNIRKAYKYTPPSKISTLPPELKQMVDDMIMSGEYSCQQIANFIMNNSEMKITQMAVNRYKHRNFKIITE